MKGDDFAYLMEREFVALIASRAEDRGFGKEEFAAKMWPWMSSKIAATRWYSIREKTPRTGKPQHVSIAEAQRMAAALGEELSYLMAVAKENAKKAHRTTAQEERQ